MIGSGSAYLMVEDNACDAEIALFDLQVVKQVLQLAFIIACCQGDH